MSIDIRYVVGRIGQAAFVLWASITVAFFVLYALPGNPALLMLGGDSASPPTPEQIAEIERQFGLDKPIFVQYLTFIWNATHGDLGTSFQSRQPVAVELSAAFGPTLQLVLFGSIAAITLGMIIGCLAVYTRTRWIRRVLEAASPIIGALPSFWVALMLMQVLSFQLALLPVAGDIGFRTLIMPGLTLGLGGGAIIAQTISRSLRATVGDHYVEVARAKGASEARVFFRHAFPNAVLPTLTIIGMMIAGMFVYTAVVETVFARRGIGYLLVSAVETKDIPVVLAVVVLAASVFVIFSLFIDLIYPILDPRIGGTRNRRRTGPLGQRSSTTPTGGNAVPPLEGMMAKLSMHMNPQREAVGSAGHGVEVNEPNGSGWPKKLVRFSAWMLHRPSLLMASLFIVFILACAFVPDLITNGDALRTDPRSALQPPSPAHWFGTDELGRDVFSRVVFGASISLQSAILAVGIGLIGGSVVGLIAGYYGGFFDTALMRIMDVMLSIPTLLFAMMLVTVIGFGTMQLAIAVGVGSIASLARVMRSQVLRIRVAEFVDAERSIGARDSYIIFRHVLPNAMGPVLALGVIELGHVLLAIAALSFLGFGAPPPSPEWGSMVAAGQAYLGVAWWMTALPGLVIVAMVVSVNRIAREMEMDP